MKLKKVSLTAIVLFASICTYAQTANRVDFCQQIPNLTSQQQEQIDEFSSSHQETMDGLRTQFRAETDAGKALGLKTRMSTEMENHYTNISGLLDPEQKTWFDQNCYANNKSANGGNQGYTSARGYRFGPGNIAGRGNRFGPANTAGRGYRCGRCPGYGRGYAARYGRGGGAVGV